MMLITDFVTWILLQIIFSILFVKSLFALPPSSSPPSSSSSSLSSPSPSSSASISFPICRQDRSGCSSKQESEFYQLGGLELGSILREPIRKVANEFDDYNRKFNDEVAKLLEKSRNDFHSMFIQTYGLAYQKHSSLITNLFDVLKSYHEDDTSVNLESEFGLFFINLYKKMFQELNSQYSFTDDFMKCTQNHMHLLNPFGDVPKKLIIEFQRSFTAVRVFSQSIKSASDIIKAVKEQPMTPNCQKYFIQMNYCQRCENSTDRIPCHGYCDSVFSVCLSSHKHLNKEWNLILDKLLSIVDRLENSFSIESAVGPLNIKVSEAIMNFQENSVNISKKIWGFCGKPKIGKRRVNKQPIPGLPPSIFPYRITTPLTQLIEEIKRNLKKFKDLWIKLPETICNSSLTPSTINQIINHNGKSCWNQSDATLQQQLVDRGEPVIEKLDFIKSQRLLLRIINQKLEAAYKGSEIPDEDDFNPESGSGSGDGDYDKDYNENDDDDDDDDNDDTFKSSTSSPQSSSSSSNVDSSSTSGSSRSTINTDVSVTKSNSTLKPGENANNNSSDNQSNELNQINTTAIDNNQQSPAQSSNNQPKGSSSLAQKSTELVITLITLSIFFQFHPCDKFSIH